jgi:hypothetical protein
MKVLDGIPGGPVLYVVTNEIVVCIVLAIFAVWYASMAG